MPSPSRERPQGSDDEETEHRRELLAQLDEIWVLVEDKGLWSRGAGAKARYLISQLTQGDALALQQRLDGARESGSVKVQVGAWIPMPAP